MKLPSPLLKTLQGWTPERVGSGESGATVYRFTRNGRRSIYLKSASGRIASSIADELVRLRWLNDHLPSPRILHFGGDSNSAWMLTESLPGLSAYDYLAANAGNRSETVRQIACFMRRMHSLPLQSCPFLSGHRLRMTQALRNIEAGIVDVSGFDDQRRGWTPERVWSELNNLLPARLERVVTHGDFSLDNILIDRCKITGVIDAGRLGIADPYQDLAILWNNLAEFGPPIQHAFLRAYGVRRLNQRKLDFHLCLDEFF